MTGIDIFLTYNEGNNVAYIDGDRVEWSDTGPMGAAPPDPAILPEPRFRNLVPLATRPIFGASACPRTPAGKEVLDAL